MSALQVDNNFKREEEKKRKLETRTWQHGSDRIREKGAL
jgi:hypothetical protein